MNKTSATLDLVGTKTLQLSATINPGSHTEGYYWTSTNSNIASVSNSGYVTGKANGTVTIKAVSSSGKVSTSCNITVKTSVAVTSGSTQVSYTLPERHQEKVDTGKEKEHCVNGDCKSYKKDCSEKDSTTGKIICHVTNTCTSYEKVCHMDTVYRNEWFDGSVKISFTLNNDVPVSKLKVQWNGASTSVRADTINKNGKNYYFYLYNSSTSSVSGTVTLKYTDGNSTLYTWTIK